MKLQGPWISRISVISSEERVRKSVAAIAVLVATGPSVTSAALSKLFPAGGGEELLVLVTTGAAGVTLTLVASGADVTGLPGADSGSELSTGLVCCSDTASDAASDRFSDSRA